MKDCHLSACENHLGARGLKVSKLFRRHALYATSDALYSNKLMHKLGGTAVDYRPFGFSQRDFLCV